MEDLQAFYSADRDGREAPRPQKGTSYKKWAEEIAAYAASPAIEGEAEYWRSRPWNRCKPLPRDRQADLAAASPQIAVVSIDENDTEALMKSAQRQYGMQIDELLLASVAEALAQWTGSRTVLIDLMHHGRVDLFNQVDVSRTVGWFSTEVPLVLDLGVAAGIEESVAAVRRELKAIPHHGIGFGIVRYVNRDEALRDLPVPEIRLNHLGRMADGASDALFRSRFDELAAQAASRLDRLVEVRTLLHKGRLQAQWLYDASVHDLATIRAVADLFAANVRALAASTLALS
jgi:non-ribosomal peptide synthase protein (TIGR01720 family)